MTTAHDTPAPRFIEVQYAPVWAWWVLIGSELCVLVGTVGAVLASKSEGARMGALGTAFAILITFALVIVFLYRMTTQVGHGQITVQFGWIPCYVKRIPVTEVATAEAKQYSPIREYGGWGIRGVGRKRALNMRGNLGVLLTMRDGATILVGSARPDLLASAIGHK